MNLCERRELLDLQLTQLCPSNKMYKCMHGHFVIERKEKKKKVFT